MEPAGRLAVGVISLRSDLRPGDIGDVVGLHGRLYAAEHGFDSTFEAYVAGPLASFACAGSPRERIWLAERGGRLVGCIAIVAGEAARSGTGGKTGADAETDTDTDSGAAAQLRWLLVDPAARGCGLGTTLLHGAIEFARAAGYRSVFLWTVEALEAAARLYRAAGFARVERRPLRLWGVDVVEERYELRFP